MAATDEPKPRIVFKKKRGHGAHHGGAWKVAYADFVTAMMALFMVLWLLTQADVKLRQQIAQYFRNPGVLHGGSTLGLELNEARSREPKVVAQDIIIVQGQAEQERLEHEKEKIEEQLVEAAALDPDFAKLRDQVIVQVTDAGLSIQVVDKGKDMLFELSSAELKPAMVVLLKKLAHHLGSLPNAVQVGGHTDSRPFPPESGISNWELAFNRANAARKILQTNGLRPGQITKVVSHADSEPLVPDNPLADENRRLSILAEREGPLPPPLQGPAEGPIVLPPDVVPGREPVPAAE